MSMRIISCGILLAAIFIAGTQSLLAQNKGPQQPPMPAMFHKMGLSGLCGDKSNLYVMAGGKILEYSLSDMTLKLSVDLPDLPAPSAPPEGPVSSGKNSPPPPPNAPHGLYAIDGYLYVLAGPVVYRYSTPDLKLQTSVELPKPHAPQGSE